MINLPVVEEDEVINDDEDKDENDDFAVEHNLVAVLVSFSVTRVSLCLPSLGPCVGVAVTQAGTSGRLNVYPHFSIVLAFANHDIRFIYICVLFKASNSVSFTSRLENSFSFFLT